MGSEDSWTRAVRKLVRLTESGEITWAPFPQLVSTRKHLQEDIEGEPFCANVEGRPIAVYQYRFKRYEDEDTWSWESDVAVEFVNTDGQLEWRWPATAYRWELLEAVRGQVAGASHFLRSFLRE